MGASHFGQMFMVFCKKSVSPNPLEKVKGTDIVFIAPKVRTIIPLMNNNFDRK